MKSLSPRSLYIFFFLKSRHAAKRNSKSPPNIARLTARAVTLAQSQKKNTTHSNVEAQ